MAKQYVRFAQIPLHSEQKKTADTPLFKELIGDKSAIKIMDDLIDDWLLTSGGEMTFELMDNYLPILLGD